MNEPRIIVGEDDESDESDVESNHIPPSYSTPNTIKEEPIKDTVVANSGVVDTENGEPDDLPIDQKEKTVEEHILQIDKNVDLLAQNNKAMALENGRKNESDIVESETRTKREGEKSKLSIGSVFSKGSKFSVKSSWKTLGVFGRGAADVATGFLKRTIQSDDREKESEDGEKEKRIKEEIFEKAKAETENKIRVKLEALEAQKREKEKAQILATHQAAEERKVRQEAKARARAIANAEAQLSLWQWKSRELLDYINSKSTAPTKNISNIVTLMKNENTKIDALVDSLAVLQASDEKAWQSLHEVCAALEGVNGFCEDKS